MFGYNVIMITRYVINREETNIKNVECHVSKNLVLNNSQILYVNVHDSTRCLDLAQLP